MAEARRRWLADYTSASGLEDWDQAMRTRPRSGAPSSRKGVGDRRHQAAVTGHELRLKVRRSGRNQVVRASGEWRGRASLPNAARPRVVRSPADVRALRRLVFRRGWYLLQALRATVAGSPAPIPEH